MTKQIGSKAGPFIVWDWVPYEGWGGSSFDTLDEALAEAALYSADVVVLTQRIETPLATREVSK